MSRVSPDSANQHQPDRQRRGAVRPLVGIVLGAVAVQLLLFSLFAWPALHSKPHDLPVVVAGPPVATAPVAAQLRHAQPGAFDISTTTDPAAADDRLRQRDAYAVFLAGPDGLRLHVASAAGPQIAELFGQVAHGIAAQSGHPVPVSDVVPADPDDPHGVVLSIGVLPLALTSLLAGVLLGLLVRGRWARLAGVLAFAVLAGLCSMAIAQYGLSALGGSYLANAASVAFLAAAVCGVAAGLVGWLGVPGAGLGALVIFVLGIPLSGLTSSPDLLPAGWGALGQYLPPGAGGTLVRCTAFFDGAGAGLALVVLSVWTAVGMTLVLTKRLPRGIGGRTGEPDAGIRA